MSMIGSAVGSGIISSGGGGGASGASDDELLRLENAEKNLGVNFLKDSISEGFAIHDMVDGFADVYTDETGVNTGASTDQVYDSSNDFYGGGGSANFTLIGATQTANSAPTNARMVVLYEAVDSSTLNTDCTIEISIDGGSTYSTAFTLVKEADYDANVEILTTDDLALDSTSGTSVVYRFKTLNEKVQRIHGVYIQWR